MSNSKNNYIKQKSKDGYHTSEFNKKKKNQKRGYLDSKGRPLKKSFNNNDYFIDEYEDYLDGKQTDSTYGTVEYNSDYNIAESKDQEISVNNLLSKEELKTLLGLDEEDNNSDICTLDKNIETANSEINIYESQTNSLINTSSINTDKHIKTKVNEKTASYETKQNKEEYKFDKSSIFKIIDHIEKQPSQQEVLSQQILNKALEDKKNRKFIKTIESTNGYSSLTSKLRKIIKDNNNNQAIENNMIKPIENKKPKVIEEAEKNKNSQIISMLNHILSAEEETKLEFVDISEIKIKKEQPLFGSQKCWDIILKNYSDFEYNWVWFWLKGSEYEKVLVLKELTPNEMEKNNRKCLMDILLYLYAVLYEQGYISFINKISYETSININCLKISNNKYIYTNNNYSEIEFSKILNATIQLSHMIISNTNSCIKLKSIKQRHLIPTNNTSLYLNHVTEDILEQYKKNIKIYNYLDYRNKSSFLTIIKALRYDIEQAVLLIKKFIDKPQKNFYKGELNLLYPYIYNKLKSNQFPKKIPTQEEQIIENIKVLVNENIVKKDKSP